MQILLNTEINYLTTIKINLAKTPNYPPLDEQFRSQNITN